jgi:cytoskeleton protein RodZ
MSDLDEAAGPADSGRPQPSELGALLVAAREQAGFGVEDVASRTRIRASLIRSMESGDFAPCGGAVYARGHLRSIAHVVGADDKTWVAVYDRMAGQPSPSAATVLEEPAADRPASVPFATLARSSRPPVPKTVQVTGQKDVPTAPRPTRSGGPPIVLPGPRAERDRRGSPLMIGAIGVVALLIVVAVVALARPHHSGSGHVAAPVATPAATSSPTPATTPTAPQTLADAGVNVVVMISAGSSWVHVVDATGSVLFQGILPAGTSRTFHSAQQLKFVFGYAPAVHLTVNGHAIGSPPATGGSDVADAVFDTQSGA